MSSSPEPGPRRRRVVHHPPEASVAPASLVSPPDRLPPAAVAATGRPATLPDRIEAARQAGYDEGWREGMAAAAASAEAARVAAATEAAEGLARAAAAVGALRAAVVAEVTADAVSLAYELLEVLVGREVALSESPGRDAVARALALAPREEDLVVRVHPGGGIDGREIEQMVGDPRVSVVEDPEVEPGGCVVSAGPCRIDAQIGPALARVRARLDAAGAGRPARLDPAARPDQTAVVPLLEVLR